MQQYILKFDDEAAAIAALPEYRATGLDGEVWDTASMIPAGIVSAPTGQTLPAPDGSGDAVPEYAPVPGWWVVLALRGPLPDALHPYHVEDQPSAVPLFSGVPIGKLPAPEPEPGPAPEPVPPQPPKVSPITFKLLFSSPERVALAAARPTDPVLDDFWTLLDDPRCDTVDLALTSTQQAVAYSLSVAGVPEADIPDRVAAILTGVVT